MIHAHGGFISQYLGDGIMALFPGSTDQAVAGALAMLDALAGFNAERRTAGLAEVRVSIGLNSGPLMLGVIGGAKRFDRGVVGDAVNLASWVAGDFVAAIRCFAACMARDPSDGAARFMVARCEELIARPPQGSWDGITRLVSKQRR